MTLGIEAFNNPSSELNSSTITLLISSFTAFDEMDVSVSTLSLSLSSCTVSSLLAPSSVGSLSSSTNSLSILARAIVPAFND